MRSEAITCDICGRVKQATNHWFVAGVQNGVIAISSASAPAVLKSSPDDLCGEDCLHKWVSVHLPELKETNAR